MNEIAAIVECLDYASIPLWRMLTPASRTGRYGLYLRPRVTRKRRKVEWADSRW